MGSPACGCSVIRVPLLVLPQIAVHHLERGELSDPVTATQAKQLMRLIIQHVLNGEELSTRVLARDLQRLGEESPR